MTTAVRLASLVRRRVAKDTVFPTGAEVRVEGLSLRFGEGPWIFRDVSFHLRRGRMLAVAGPSGVGKTSLMRCLAGLLPACCGQIAYRLSDGTILTPALMGARLAMVFQSLRLTGAASSIDNVCFGRLGRHPFFRTLLGFPRGEREEAYAELCALGLCHQAHSPVSRLSGGERQRVAVARALHQDADVILADEPVASLDKANAQRCLMCLRQRAVQDGLTVIVVLHDEDLIERYADEVLRLDAVEPGEAGA